MHLPGQYRSSAVERLPSGAPPRRRLGPPTSDLWPPSKSLHGISHNKIEDTKEEHLGIAVTAFDKLADKAIRWIERSAAR
jgi:N-carbamoyl-L-amino-acid hydrolase